MNRIVQHTALARVVVASFVIAGLTGCATRVFEPADTSTPISCLVSSVTIIPAQVNMNLGEHLRVTAMTRGCPGEQKVAVVRWSSSDTLIVRVDSTGVVEARKVGSASVIARLVADPTVQAAMVVNVTTF